LILLVGFAAALSLIAIVAGSIWMLVSAAQTHRRWGPDVGAEIMAGPTSGDEGRFQVAESGVFKGNGVEVKREATISFADVKRQIASGQWQAALPALVTMAGFFGLVLFGGLGAVLVSEDKRIGALVALVALYALIRMAVNMVRS
jgi:hypothetical protein